MPVTFYEDPTAVAVRPVSGHPLCVRMGRDNVAAWDPNVAVTVPAMVSAPVQTYPSCGGGPGCSTTTGGGATRTTTCAKDGAETRAQASIPRNAYFFMGKFSPVRCRVICTSAQHLVM